MVDSYYLIGIDIGGTQIAAGLWSPEENLLKIIEMPTRYETEKALFNQIEEIINELRSLLVNDEELKAVGICIPGRIENGFVYSDSLGFPNGIPLMNYFEEIVPCPVLVENDANAAALGEYVFGAARGCENILYVGIGTGIGAGLIIHGQLYLGFRHLAGEFGHIVVDPSGPMCTCGRRGCVEAIASGTSIVKRANDQIINRKCQS